MLINCVAYREGKKLAKIDIEEISDYPAALAVIVGACTVLFFRFRRMGWL
jgi:hypothetical protein